MINKSDNELLEAFKKVLPYLQYLFEEDISIGITDREKYIEVQNCDKLPINLRVGNTIRQHGGAVDAFETRNAIIRDVPKEVYGVPVKSYAIPLKDESNAIVGALIAGKSLQRRYEVINLSENIAASLQQISASVKDISAGVQAIFHSNKQISEKVNESTEYAKGTNDVLNFVRSVSNQTNLLGLNAAIESARVGEMGKGFSVVAQEIRKLAATSSESIKKIDMVLKKIEDSITNISHKVIETSTVIETQAANFQEISASVEELSTIAGFLEELAKKL